MKLKKLMSLLLTFIMVLAVAPVISAEADEATLVNGIRGDYHLMNSGFAFGELKSTYIDKQINFPNLENIFANRTGQSDNTATRWTATIIPEVTGDYVFSALTDNGLRLYVGNDNTPIINWWVNDWDKEQFAPSMRLVAGEKYSFKMEHMEVDGGSHATLYWNMNNSGKTTVPANVFHLREDFNPTLITGLDTTGAILKEEEIDGNATISFSNLKEDTALSIISSSGAEISYIDELTIISKTENTIIAKIPTDLKIGVYKFLAVTDSVHSVSDSSVVISSDNVRKEHPRPDWKREQYINLNGIWDFKFDPDKVGETEHWYTGDIEDLSIIVPFPWEAPASGIGATEYLGTAWYQRNLYLDDSWTNQEVIIKFGAVDWKSTLYVNGQKVGDQVGGYTPFEYDITDYVTIDGDNKITLMVNDEASFGKISYTALVGKQGHNAPCGYTHTSGIWQTVIVEGRNSSTQIEYAHIDPDVDNSKAKFKVSIVDDKLNIAAMRDLTIKYDFKSTLWDDDSLENNFTGSDFSGSVNVEFGGKLETDFTVDITNQKLWWPEEANLYDGTIELWEGTKLLDSVDTYFGQRKISTGIYHEDEAYEYIYLNNKPVFLSGLLDQGFWEEGIYTAPTEEALKFDISSMRSVGFNLIRKHLKIEDPLQYFWADRLGMMVWADMPHATNMNYTGGEDGSGRKVFEDALESMINRDYNHPSLISYILFNETWGINHNTNTDQWIRDMYQFTKDLDTSGRLTEDMSPCNNDHLQPTDINTFHMYPGSYGGAKGDVDNRDAQTYPGSRNNFNGHGVTGGATQQGEPWLNSEYGGVGAYAGDHDVSWCFKYQTDIQRLRQKLNGFVYTEPYDIEYESNGILNYDRSWKIFGYDEIAYGGDMGIKYLTQADYIGIDKDPMVTLSPGGTYNATVGMIRWSDYVLNEPVLKWRLDGTDVYGNKIDTNISGTAPVVYAPYTYETKQISFTIPSDNQFAKFAGTVTVWIEDASGKVIAKNFSNLKVTNNVATNAVEHIGENSYALRSETPVSNTVSGGVGEVTYQYLVPTDFDVNELTNLRILAELSSIKSGDTQTAEGEEKPSDVSISINGHEIDTVYIPDAPRDMRGTLSLDSGRASAQEFGYLVNLNLNEEIISALAEELATGNVLNVTYKVASDAKHKNGIKFYNENRGRYAVSPMVVLNPSELHIDKSEHLLDMGGDINLTVDSNNYSIETDLGGGGDFTIDAGYKIKKTNETLTVYDSESHILASKELDSSILNNIKVVFFDKQVRVYIDNNPEVFIDVYGDEFASTDIWLFGGDTILSNFTIVPETYDNASSVISEVDVQFVESFNMQDAFNRWTSMGTTSGNLTGSFSYVRNPATGTITDGKVAYDAGSGHKLVYTDAINASSVVAEMDISVDSIRSGYDGNAGFIIRGSNFNGTVDGADGYYVGIGFNRDTSYNSAFIEVGKMHQGWTRLAHVPATITQGEVVRLKAVAVGSRIMVYLNDNPVPYVDIYDETYASGSFAIRGFNAAGTFDNIVISTAPFYEANFDDFGTTAAKLNEWAINGSFEIENQAVKASDDSVALVGSETWSDVDVSVDINQNSNACSGIVFRAIKGKMGVNGYAVVSDKSNNTVTIGKIVNDSFSAIDSISSSVTSNLRIVAVNNQIKVYADENVKPIMSIVDNTYTNGKIGLISLSGTTIFDNFVSKDKFRYEEQFNDGALSGWGNIKGNWTINDNVLDVAVGVDDKLVDGYATRGDFILDFDLRLNSGNTNKYNAGIVFRATDFGAAQDALRGYVLGLNVSAPGVSEPSGLELGDIRYGWRALTTANVPFAVGNWYHMTIVAEGTNIKVFVDDVLYIDINDPAYAYGQIALRNFNAAASYKNLSIRELDDIDPPVIKDDFEIIVDDVSNTLTATLYNNTQLTVEVPSAFVAAIYDEDGRLVAHDTVDVTTVGESHIAHTFNLDLDQYPNHTFKVFAWETPQYTPLCKNALGTINALAK